MAGYSTWGNSKREGSSPPELGKAARTLWRSLCLEPGSLKSIKYEGMYTEGTSIIDRIKGLVEIPELFDIDFDERVKDVEELMGALQY